MCESSHSCVRNKGSNVETCHGVLHLFVTVEYNIPGVADDAGRTWMRCGHDVDDDACVVDDAGMTWMRCGHNVDDDAVVTWMGCGRDVDDDAGVTSKRENELSC